VFGVDPQSARWPATTAARFARLRVRFLEDAAFVSSLNELVEIASFRDIVAMGSEAVKELEVDLKANDAPWLPWVLALRQILRDGPIIPDAEAGVREKVLARWFAWLPPKT
jgi:hypothetical protein